MTSSSRLEVSHPGTRRRLHDDALTAPAAPRDLRRLAAPAWVFSLLLIAAPLQAQPEAPAEPPANAFGAEGQKVVFGHVALELALGEQQPGGDIKRDLAASATPGLLYFVDRDLALGLATGAWYGDYELADWPYQQFELELLAGIGINFPLGPGISLFPQLWAGIGYRHIRYDDLFAGLPSYTDPAFPVERPDLESAEGIASGTVLIPLQFELGAATYVAVGPQLRLRTGFEQAAPVIRFGIAAGIGSYF